MSFVPISVALPVEFHHNLCFVFCLLFNHLSGSNPWVLYYFDFSSQSRFCYYQNYVLILILSQFQFYYELCCNTNKVLSHFELYHRCSFVKILVLSQLSFVHSGVKVLLHFGVFYYFRGQKLPFFSFVTYLVYPQFIYIYIYGRNQSGCEKTEDVGFLPFILSVFLTIYIFCCFDENFHVF